MAARQILKTALCCVQPTIGQKAINKPVLPPSAGSFLKKAGGASETEKLPPKNTLRLRLNAGFKFCVEQIQALGVFAKKVILG